MEEAPKIERLISSRGIALSDAANILKSYVAIIDHHHGPRKPSSADDIAPSSDDGGDDDTNKKSRQDLAEEKEEERLLARLGQLDPKESLNNRLGSISEDVYERLRMIMESVCGEAEGRVVSAVGVYASAKAVEQSGEEGGGVNEEVDNGEDEFMKELEEAERLETDQLQEPKEEEEQPQQQQQQIDYDQKKKDKKEKKAAKKAKKEAKKRKASSGGANEEKRIKVEEDQD
mmetsp:Transcript_17572/g.35087  ORF Transcript_17572/g.35087 Transcript_17572/m.35087 type:complete len:231 (-) Transcript_17572:192-884(-)